MRKARGGGGFLGVALLAGVVALVGCGGKSGSSTASSSSSQTLKRLDVHVVRGSSAEAPQRSMLARIGDLLGWPQVAEASSGIPGCTVTAGAQSAVTNADGNATLTGVTFPSTVAVTCPGGPSGSFPVTGAPGAIVKVEVEVGSIEVKVKNQHVSQPSVSQPSQPSPPSQPSQKSG